jgi:hypothetical protein
MMPYLSALELTAPQTGPQQRERDLNMGRLVARLSFRRTARLQKQREPDSAAARRTPARSTIVTVQVDIERTVKGSQ